MELLNPARVNHMPSTGKSTPPALLDTGRPRRGVWGFTVLGECGEKGVRSQVQGGQVLFPGVK